MKEVNFIKLNFESVKWSEMFDSEQELIDCLKGIKIDLFKKNCLKGFELVEGFQKALSNGKDLTPRQITQLKRIAKEIYRYYRKLDE